jgi:hypothetical protein
MSPERSRRIANEHDVILLMLDFGDVKKNEIGITFRAEN